MTLEILQKEMIQAMKDKLPIKKEVLSSAIGAIKNAAIAKKCRDTIPEELVNEVLLKEKKTLQEQIDTCPKEREDLLVQYEERMSYLVEYCPKLLSNPQEIEQEILYLCNDNFISITKENRGQLMKMIMPYFKGKADMKIVQQVLTDLIARNSN